MQPSLFEELGLSPNEAKIYHVLLTYGGSGVSTIALRAKLHRSNTYDTLHRLVEKGLVYEVFHRKETGYEAVDPTKLREILQEKVLQLDAQLPDLLAHFQKNRVPERVSIYKGIEGVKNYMRLALQTGEDVYTLGGKGAWLDPRLHMFFQEMQKQAKRKKMRFYNLFEEQAARAIPDGPQRLSTAYKLLPKGHTTTSSIDIFGEYVVTFTGMSAGTLEEDLTIFVLASEDLAESYRQWWQVLWDALPEPPKEPR